MGDSGYPYHDRYHSVPEPTPEIHAYDQGHLLEDIAMEERRSMTLIEKIQNSQCITDIAFVIGLLLIFAFQILLWVLWAQNN